MTFRPLTLGAPEVMALVGGLLVWGASAGKSRHRVSTQRPETLTSDFSIHLFVMGTRWQMMTAIGVLEGRDRETGAVK